MKVCLKPPDFGHTNGKNLKNLKNLNNVIKHKRKVPYASFDENCAQTRTLFSTPFNIRGNHFLFHGADKVLTSVFITVFHPLK